MVVADTNVLAYLWLPGAHTPLADRLCERDPDWHAPLLWRSEFRSVLAGYLRRGHLTPLRSLEIADAAERQMAGREYTVRSVDVLRLVEASSCSAYDCEFVALARDLGVPLVTSDRQVLAQFPDTAVSLAEAAGR